MVVAGVTFAAETNRSGAIVLFGAWPLRSGLVRASACLSPLTSDLAWYDER